MFTATESYEEEEVENVDYCSDEMVRRTSVISELGKENNSEVDGSEKVDTDQLQELSLEDQPESEGDRCDGDVYSSEWKQQNKHVFILSEAGKPIYSRHGNEDKLVTLMGVMQALVSFVQESGDIIRSFHAGEHKFVFLNKSPLILVCVSNTKASVPQLQNQLIYIYNQILSVLTYSQLRRIFEQRHNYDLRRLLGGAEKMLDNLIDIMDQDPSFLLTAVRSLPLDNSVREQIGQTLSYYCGKIKNVVFAILIAENQLVTLVRMKKYSLHPADLHLIMNLVKSSESLKTAESWIPICLPKFDSSGFLHAHISYLDDSCPACLLLLTVDKELFYSLQECRRKIVERLRKHHCLELINKSLKDFGYSVNEVGIPDLKHFLYKSRSTAQYTSPRITAPYLTSEDWTSLFGLYQYLHRRMYNPSRPLKTLFYAGNKETMMGWHMQGFELYAAFEPLVTKLDATTAMKEVVHWIKREETRLFVMDAPTM